MSQTSSPPTPPREKSITKQPITRKSFLRFAGTSAATAIAFGLYGCNDLNNTTGANGEASTHSAKNNSMNPVDLGTGDIGILNFAYALEQLEAEFYIRVLENPYEGMSGEEGRILEDVQKHEEAHRDFFKAALGSDAIRDLEVDFSSIDFSKCSQVLQAARTFEDLGVSAYNGAGQLLENTDFLLVAGKIVSVEARHAAAIRDLIEPRTGNFAGDDIIDENGLDVVNNPDDVLTAASDFIVDEIDASGLPQPNNG